MLSPLDHLDRKRRLKLAHLVKAIALRQGLHPENIARSTPLPQVESNIGQHGRD